MGMDEIGNQLSEIQEIQEVHFLAGDDGYLVKMQVSDTHELGQIVKDDISRIDFEVADRFADGAT